ncbi:tetraprenyl-beta-curcumene synthase family protein [Marinisporobacter balticus]|uniref:Tetraprenyl-beta-curcumene synthase n=1 Tax=Marinisporobacter balticus TaxID=2018667 RepID=A0A4R2KUI4_9FIRM|nr:tetraprenyl-beta-curcumene synthase family protein [Marinisporobacter balticus]TCO78081.1 tetraprenyl-beta-curcumene synthase [Marinisporobacter balticus]
MHKTIYQSKLIYNFVKKVFPKVKKELNHWKNYAHTIPDQVLSQQALLSIQKKSFHAQGGCIYSLYDHQINKRAIQFIVALQTISDYLDNLCDRVGVEDEVSFLNLHKAITNALNPDTHFSDYYKDYPYKEDGNYLYALVNTCKCYIRTLPNYNLVQENTLYLGKLYGEMQSYKHIALSKREKAMHTWASKYLYLYDGLSTWEFSSAAGSTLGIFLLCTLAEDKNLDQNEVKKVMNTYFPSICGLHILLDYFIDEKEDLSTGDLNFVSYYKNKEEKEKRLIYFLNQSFNKSFHLKNPLFHLTVIEGLIAMYLSDPKTNAFPEKITTRKILKNASCTANTLYFICKLLRKKSIISSV